MMRARSAEAAALLHAAGGQLGRDPAKPPSCGAAHSPLHRGAQRGDVDLVRTLLRAGADPNEAAAWWHTPLYQAVKAGHPDVVRVLLRAGAAVDDRSWELAAKWADNPGGAGRARGGRGAAFGGAGEDPTPRQVYRLLRLAKLGRTGIALQVMLGVVLGVVLGVCAMLHCVWPWGYAACAGSRADCAAQCWRAHYQEQPSDRLATLASLQWLGQCCMVVRTK